MSIYLFRPLESLDVDGLVRLWAHEALRLFHDRLVSDEERRWTNEYVDLIALKVIFFFMLFLDVYFCLYWIAQKRLNLQGFPSGSRVCFRAFPI